MSSMQSFDNMTSASLPDSLLNDVDLAYLSGSRIVGLDHGSSDSDLHVVLKDGTQRKNRIVATSHGSFQLTYDDPTRLIQVLDDCNQFDPNPSQRGPYGWSSQLERVAYRLYHSRIIFASPWWQERLASHWRNHIPRAFMGLWALRSARYAVAFEGMLSQGDIGNEELMYSASLGTYASINVALASLGDVYTSDKFLMLRFDRKTELSGVRNQLHGLLHKDTLPLMRRAKAVHSIGQYITAHSLINNWSNELQGNNYAYPELDLKRNQMGPGFSLIRYPNAWSLAGVPKSYRIDSKTAAAWLSLAPNAKSANPPSAAISRFSSLGLVVDSPTTNG